MAKDKQFEADWKAEGKRRSHTRKVKRLVKFTKHRAFVKKSTGCCCGEEPYCYCGSGTPGVIDY